MSRPTRSVAYRLTEAVELYVAGSNLLHATHLESNDPERAQLAQRSLYRRHEAAVLKRACASASLLALVPRAAAAPARAQAPPRKR